MSFTDDFVIGRINELRCECDAGWAAFYRKDSECEALRMVLEGMHRQIRLLTEELNGKTVHGQNKSGNRKPSKKVCKKHGV